MPEASASVHHGRWVWRKEAACILAARKHRERMPALTGPPTPPPFFYPSSWDGTTHTQRRFKPSALPLLGLQLGTITLIIIKERQLRCKNYKREKNNPCRASLSQRLHHFPPIFTQTKQVAEVCRSRDGNPLSRDGNGARCDLRAVLLLATLSSQAPQPAVSTSQRSAISWRSSVQ